MASASSQAQGTAAEGAEASGSRSNLAPCRVDDASRRMHTPDGQYAFDLSETGLLGAGAHGVVRIARHLASGEHVAVKVMPASVLSAVGAGTAGGLPGVRNPPLGAAAFWCSPVVVVPSSRTWDRACTV